MRHRWRIWVDTGGTFTDCIAYSPEGKQNRVKVLSSSKLRGRVIEIINHTTFKIQTNWNIRADIFTGYQSTFLASPNEHYEVEKVEWSKNLLILNKPITKEILCPTEFEITAHEEAPILAARLATGTMLKEGLPKMEMRLGTTKGTNALLERKGEKVAFITTKGFGDLLEIGTQQRPDLFSLNIQKTKPFYAKVFEIDERIDAKGNILNPLTHKDIYSLVNKVQKSGCEAIAIALMHSYLNNKHEHMLMEAFQYSGFDNISCSHLLAPSIKILPRANTAVINAFLSNTLTRLSQ